MNFDIQQCI